MNEQDFINKKIEKQCIIVDSYKLNPSNKSNFTINFDQNGYGGVFNNVIGFRLKKAILRNNPILINGSNSTIELGGGIIRYLVKTAYGFYTGSSWAALLSGSNWTANSDGSGSGSSLSIGTVTYNPVTNKLEFDATGATFKFTTYKDVSRLLGFDPDTSVDATSDTSLNPIDITNHYIDVVVPEIPYIACKKTHSGKNVIDRIPMIVSGGAIQYYACDPSDLQSHNYFFPIKLSQITIQLYSDKEDLLQSTDEHSSFEFEVTLLKNNKF
tara:strand:- start:74 stop:880 length:807 start_codon:yes stop_codon:yes gene_type:complete